ncbi:MAG TPA: neutral zinc metallopeptidase [Polyangiaceae bacterium]|nr:neutral zinc metallopeptidase [Polyangiaceae bacterium]
MKWDRDHDSPDVIDERGRGGGGDGFGLLGPLISIGSRFGFGGVLVAVGLYVGAQFLFGGGSSSSRLSGGTPSPASGADDTRAKFAGFVLDDVQATWTRVFANQGASYRRAKLVLYTDQTRTACGYGSAAMGPFYCPNDERVFLDLGFFDELSRKLGAPGDFAQAYVIAHEIGHHVQHLRGGDRADHGEGASGGSVRIELQADCYAGIWARTTEQRNLLEQGDIEAALGAAIAVGDDRLQRSETGTVNPEKWTHGSSKERAAWFRRGLDQGTFEACDTSKGPL